MKFLRIFFLSYFLWLPVLRAEISSYTVVSGDTLWALSSKNYGNPYLWPSLWEVNKATVTNPHLIYTGQILFLPSKDEIKNVKISHAAPPPSVTERKKYFAKTEEPSEIVSAAEESELSAKAESSVPWDPEQSEITKEELQAMPSPTIAGPAAKRNVGVEAKLVGEKFVPDGVIVGLKEYKILTAQGDVVYIDTKLNKFSKSDLLTIYRKTKKIKRRDDRGYELVKIGMAEIIDEPLRKFAPAKILFSHDPVEIGDWVIRVNAQR